MPLSEVSEYIINSIMALDRKYPIIEPHENYKDISYGLLLMTELEKLVESPSMQFIEIDDYKNAVKLRTIGYILSRVISSANYYYKKYYKENTTEYEYHLLHNINKLFDTDAQTKDRIFRLVKRICEMYQMDHTNLTSSQSKFVKEFAKSNLHNCYICGRTLNYEINEDKEKRNSMEIEHIFPRVYGGGRGKTNITACCENCNKMKGNKITFADTFFEGFFSSSDDGKKVKKCFSLESRLSMLMFQNSRCFHCDSSFHSIDSTNIYLGRKNENDVYHFMNCYFYCETCHNDKNLEGIPFDVDEFLGGKKYDQNIQRDSN